MPIYTVFRFTGSLLSSVALCLPEQMRLREGNSMMLGENGLSPLRHLEKPPQVVRMGKYFIKSLRCLESNGIIKFGFSLVSPNTFNKAKYLMVSFYQILRCFAWITSFNIHNCAKRWRCYCPCFIVEETGSVRLYNFQISQLVNVVYVRSQHLRFLIFPLWLQLLLK